jgi:predicted aldo/keto reductase-like oxidoreductase
VQLQLNYLDWDNDKVQSRKLYQTARNYDKPVVIMEPIKGGMLGSEESPIAKDFKAARPDASVASWALRFVGELDGLIAVLSGMSALSQVEDNVKTFKDLQPLDESELLLLRGAVDILNNSPRIPCTDCKYCITKCPQKINIPAMMNLYSDYLVYHTTANVDHVYNMITRGGGKANTCVSCRACEEMCPQHIEIADNLAKFSAVID